MLKLIKILKDRLIKVKKEKKSLAKLEMKLRSMRRLAVCIRDEEDMPAKEKEEIQEEFNRFKVDIRNLG